MVGSRSWQSCMIDNQIISSCWTPPLFLIAFLFLITEETKAAWFERPVLGRSQQTWCGDRISLLWEGERQDADAACPWCMSFLYTHLDFYHSEMCEIYTTLITSLSLISDIYPATSKSDPLNFLKISDFFYMCLFPKLLLQIPTCCCCSLFERMGFFFPVNPHSIWDPHTADDVRGVSCCVGTACTHPQAAGCSGGAQFTKHLIHIYIGLVFFFNFPSEINLINCTVVTCCWFSTQIREGDMGCFQVVPWCLLWDVHTLPYSSEGSMEQA